MLLELIQFLNVTNDSHGSHCLAESSRPVRFLQFSLAELQTERPMKYERDLTLLDGAKAYQKQWCGD